MGKTDCQDVPWDAAQAILVYRETQDLSLRNDLVIHYSYIAKIAAVQMRTLAGAYGQMEDLLHNGLVTLMECIERFDPYKGVKFETYAFMRIKNANIDYIRSQDWMPRRIRKAAKDIMAVYDQLWGELLREPTTSELAERMGMSVEQLNHRYGEISGAVLISFENLLQGAAGSRFAPTGEYVDRDSMPENQILRGELREHLVQALEQLTERERLVVSLYYQEGLRFHEVGEVMSISESRVCQIHGKAMIKLRKYLRSYQEDRPVEEQNEKG